METITREEAIAALAAAVEPGDTNSYYVTSAPAEQYDDVTVYMVGYAAADPEESDPEGDPSGFTRINGTVVITGPSF